MFLLYIYYIYNSRFTRTGEKIKKREGGRGGEWRNAGEKCSPSRRSGAIIATVRVMAVVIVCILQVAVEAQTCAASSRV